MTRVDDERLGGRPPEFARMSLKPGIGLGAMHEVASTLLWHELEKRDQDVPAELRHGEKRWPLGRYLRRNLRLLIGREAGAHEKTLEEASARLRDLREVARGDEAEPSLRSHLLASTETRRRSLKVRSRIYRGRRKL